MEEHRRYIEECQQCGDEAILENHHNDLCQCNQGLSCPYYKKYAKCPECYSLYFDDWDCDVYTDYDSNSDFGNDEYSDDYRDYNGNDDNSNSDNDSDDTSSIISAASTIHTK